MELSQNPITEQIDQEQAALDTTSAAPNDNAPDQPEYTPEQEARIVKMFKLFRRARDGKLTFHDFRQLPAVMRHPYVKKFGVPKTREALVGIAKRIVKRRNARKFAMASRRRNRA